MNTQILLLFAVTKRCRALEESIPAAITRLINDGYCFNARVHFDTNAKVTAAITIVADARR